VKRLPVFAAVFVMSLVTSGVLLAQNNPFVGTWKLNSAKSKYTTGVAPKEITATIQIVGDQDQVTENGTAADGSQISLKYAFPDKGGPGKVLAGGNLAKNPFDGVSGKRIDDKFFEVSFMKGGKEMLHNQFVVSKDGKTLRETVSGFVPLGNPVSGVLVWDKQ
jgi:hypothetical protein